MERRATQTINIKVKTDGIQLTSEYVNEDPELAKTITSEKFGSFTDASKSLDTLYKMYTNLAYMYAGLALTQVLGIAVNFERQAYDIIKNNSLAASDDMLRLVGLVGITTFTAVACGFAYDEKLKTKNKQSAVKTAERTGEQNFEDTYPL